MCQMANVAASSLTTGGISLDDIYTLLTLFGCDLLFFLGFAVLYFVTSKIDEHLIKEDEQNE